MAHHTKPIRPYSEEDNQGTTLSPPSRTHSLQDLDSSTMRRDQLPRGMKPSIQSPKMIRTMSDSYASIETGSMTARKQTSRRPPQRQRSSYSISEDSDDILYTRTGRVSKALKGKRVHECDFCDKVFTRAEHLKRHKLNHSDRVLHCHVFQCRKEFKRHDLLARHMEEHKHNESLSEQPIMSRQGSSSRTRQSSASLELQDWNNSRGRTLSAPAVFNPSQALSMSRDNSIFSSSVPIETALGISCDGSYDPVITGLHNSWESPYAPAPISAFGSPRSDYSQLPIASVPYVPLSNLHYNSSTTSYTGEWMSMDPIGSRSPASVSSSLPQAWHQADEFPRARTMLSPSGSEMSMLPYSLSQTQTAIPHAEFESLPPSIVDGTMFNQQDVFEEAIIRAELTDTPGLLTEPDDLAYLDSCHNRYIASFWKSFHPMFPIIHRPTFEGVGAPALLKALVVAIGAHFLQDQTAKSLARALRDTSLKLVGKRANVPYRMSRMWDLQITFLAEAFSLYRSRRPLVRFSQRFEDLCTGVSGDILPSMLDPAKEPLQLLHDRDVFFARPLEELAAQPFNSDVDVVRNWRVQWLHIESTRRLFLATYILEMQQATFFQTLRSGASIDFPWPCSQSLWEAESLNRWRDLAKQEPLAPFYLLDALSQAQRHKHISYDTFQSAIVNGYFTNSQDSVDHPHAREFAQYIEQHPRTLFNHHASMLTIYVPIRDLLAVSGETFVLGEKLATRDQFVQAEMDLRAWSRSDNAIKAVFHATKVIRIAFEEGKCGLLHEEWSLYLAALVCWAYGMWPVQEGGQPRNQVLGTVHQEMTEFVFALSCCGSTPAEVAGALTFSSVRNCMAWVRDQINGQLGGLVGDAVEVLEKLVNRRHEARL